MPLELENRGEGMMGSSGDAKKLWRSKTVFKNQRRAARLGDAGGRDSRVEVTRCKSWAARGVPTVQFTRPVPPGRRTSQNVRTSKSPSCRICRKITTMITLTSFALARSRAHQASRSADSRMCAEGRAHRPVMGSSISFLDWLFSYILGTQHKFVSACKVYNPDSIYNSWYKPEYNYYN